MATQIQIRRDTTAGWAEENPVLAEGELGLDTDLNTFKIGNGTATWSELAFYAGSGDTIVPLPGFLAYTEGRSHLSTLNTNFGWNSEGLWFGPAVGDPRSESYPVFTNFTLAATDKVVVSFNVSVDSFCSDMGVCVYVDGTIPSWTWGVDETRIAAQFNCPNPQIYGLTIDEQSEAPEDNIPNPGMYQVVFTYDPTAETEKVIFQYFNGETQLTRLTLNEALPSGNYRVGFAADNNVGDELAQPPYRTYISDLGISINDGETLYSDTLQNGNSGGSVDIADFIFDTVSEEGTVSRMTIHNHDMVIRTTRDDNEDADISITSADDIWIRANDTVELTSETNEITFYTNTNGHQWAFGVDGYTKFPYQTSNQRTGSGEVLRFSDSGSQSIITGPAPTTDTPTAQRLVIAGQDGFDGTDFDGEGGDIYLWAGRGGGTTGDGGDIKIDGGNGGTDSGQGGYVKVRGGDSQSSTGGFVEITAGDSYSASGGNVSITAGNNNSAGEASGGSVSIYGGGSADAEAGGGITLETFQNGKITLLGAGGEFINDSSVAGNQIATIGHVATAKSTYSKVNVYWTEPYAAELAHVGALLYAATVDDTPANYVIPTDATLDFPVGSEIKFATNGACAWSINTADSLTTTLVGEGSNNYTYVGGPFIVPSNATATLLKVDDDRWILSGLRLTD